MPGLSTDRWNSSVCLRNYVPFIDFSCHHAICYKLPFSAIGTLDDGGKPLRSTHTRHFVFKERRDEVRLGETTRGGCVRTRARARERRNKKKYKEQGAFLFF